MLNYETAKKNYETIREFGVKYRNELTIFQGVTAEYMGLMPYQDYVKLMSEVPEDVFVGNMLSVLLNSDTVDIYGQILNEEKEFECFVEQFMTDEIKELYNEKISIQ